MHKAQVNGQFIISLDFELFWGTCEKRQLATESAYLDNTMTVIPQMLHLFERNGIHVSWATVGMLFLNNWDDWDASIPSQLPQYDNPVVSTYQFARGVQRKVEEEKYFFAPEHVRLIANTPYQEMCSHTFSHYYCTEPGQTVATFLADLQAANEAAERYGITMSSLVFPRNQYNEDYLNACFTAGYTSVRSNPSVWYWQENQKDGLSRKIFRTGDAYLPIRQKNAFSISATNKGNAKPLSAPGNRLLRPHNIKYPLLNKLRLRNVLTEMEYAAKRGLCYHLWWHPENYGRCPKGNMEDLEVIIAKFQALKSKYGFSSASMSGLEQNIILDKEVV